MDQKHKIILFHLRPGFSPAFSARIKFEKYY